VLLRTRRAGGRNAVDASHLLFVEIDHPNAQERLAAFPHAPTASVRSGFIRSSRSWARGVAGDERRRHVANGSGVVDARDASTTYDMYDLLVAARVGVGEDPWSWWWWRR
jgi:hypothetical protein